MKIACLVPTVVEGQSGVGDQTLLLISQIQSMGHIGCLIACAENNIQQPEEGFIHFGEQKILSFRLPASMSWPKRWEQIQQFLEKNSPWDWLSLQFVPYIFHPRGFVFGLEQHLKQIFSGRWHIMFHETWIGQMKGASWKHRCIGAIQRLSIQRMVKKLAPQLAHTSMPTYQDLLQNSGISTRILPLFGNVAVEGFSADQHFDFIEQNAWHFGIFGTLHPVWASEPLLPYLIEAGKRANRKILLISIGHLGYGHSLWKEVQRKYQNQITFHTLGKLPASKISQIMQRLDYGISTTPLQVIGKSSAGITMLEHGLPLIVNRQEFYGLPSDSIIPNDPLIIPMTADLPNQLVAGIPKQPCRSRLPSIAAQWIDDLKSAEK